MTSGYIICAELGVTPRRDMIGSLVPRPFFVTCVVWERD